MKQGSAKWRAWSRLTPNHRRILLSHRPDELECEEALTRGTRADLEEAFGPTQWESTVAILAEGEAESKELRTVRGAAREPGVMLLAEIGELLGLTREGARLVQEKALRKLRDNVAIRCLLLEHLEGRIPTRTERAMIRALLDAHVNPG